MDEQVMIEIDEADVIEVVIELLRANGGKAFRELLQTCREDDRETYEKLIRAPRLRDLVPN
jgi:hypothetical protein